GVERAGTELANAVLERCDAPGREHAAHQAAMQVVYGWVLEDEHAARSGHTGADHFEHRPLAGNEGLPLARAGLDVREAADRKEVVAVVAVQRHLVAHALPDRIRIVVDLEVVRVVVDLARAPSHVALCRHLPHSFHLTAIDGGGRISFYFSESQS